MRRLMKRLVDGYVDGLEDPLPDALRAKHRLVPLAEALRAGHFPKADTDYAGARRRLVYDEFLLLQLGLAIRRQRQGRQPGARDEPARRARPASPRRAAVRADRSAGAGVARDPRRTWRSPIR